MKNSKKNNLYKSLNSAFEQFKDSPPDKVWGAVEIDLAKKQLDRDKKRFFWMHWSSAVIILFFVSFGIYELINYTNNKQSANKNNEKHIQTNRNHTLANNSNIDNSVTTKTESKNTGEIFPELNQKKNKIENNKDNVTSQINHSENNNKPSKEKIIAVTPLTENILKPELTTTSKQKEDVILKNSAKENNEINIVAQTSIQSDTSEKQIVKSVQPDSAITILTKITADSLIKQSSDSSIVLASNAKTDSTNQITSVTPPKEQNKILSRLSVSAIFSPDYSSRLLTNNKDVAGYSASQFNKQETPVFAFSSGLKIGYDLSDKWNIQTGATYSYMEQTLKPTNITVDTSLIRVY